MNEIEFTVYSTPIPQPRQRHRIIKAGGRVFAHNYTPAKHPVNAFKYHVQVIAKQTMDREPLWTCAVAGTFEFYLPRPKSSNAKRYDQGALYHAGRKDVDNLFKSVADALTGIVYQDDGQLCHVTISKRYHEASGQPRVIVRIGKLLE